MMLDRPTESIDSRPRRSSSIAVPSAATRANSAAKRSSSERSRSPTWSRARPQVRILGRYFAAQVARIDRGERAEAESRVTFGGRLFDQFRVTAGLILADTDTFVLDARAEQERRTNTLTLFLLLIGAAALALAIGLAVVVPRRAARLLDALEEERASAVRARERTARLQEMTAHLAGAATVSEVAQTVLEKGKSATGAAAGSIALLKGDGTMLESVGVVGYSDEIVAAFPFYPATAPLPIPDAIRRGPLWLPTAAEVIASYPHLATYHRQTGHEAVASLPLVIDGRNLGGLALSFSDPRPFGPRQREFLTAIAEICAQALDRARLYDAERRESERRQFLAEAGVLLSTTLESRVTLAEPAHLSVPRLADWCIVSVEEGGEIKMVEVAHRDPARVALAKGITARFPAHG